MKPADWDRPLILANRIPDGDWYGKKPRQVELTEGWAMTAMAPRADGTSPLTPPRDGYAPSISWLLTLAALAWVGVALGVYYGIVGL